MGKFGYILLTAVSFVVFNSCSSLYRQETIAYAPKNSISTNSYGSYLAGRIAHYRQDFNAAADYYMKTAQKDTNNPTLLSRTYLMLASQGRISEAAHYAKLAQKQGDTNDFIPAVLAAEDIKQKNYAAAIQTLNSKHSDLYKKIINPFFNAWSYTGLNQYDKAIEALNAVKKQVGMEALYHFHAGMINDYFDKPDKAREHYESILNDSSMELSVRALEIICNFYLRNGETEKAHALSAQYAKTVPSVDILQKIHDKIVNASQAQPLIISPQMGLSEALFNIAAIVKSNSEVLDFSHIFIRMAIYENPQNDLARILLANILEIREMYKDAITVYDEIPASSPAYFIAQYKKAANLRNLDDYKGSELLLKSLILDYPDDYQLLLDLGDTLRLQEKYKEALKYYNQALEKHHGSLAGLWQVYYAVGITNERLGKWHQAEKNLIKALQISPNNILVLNYLGYTWLNQGKKTEEAFSFIIKAYNQAPYNSSIIDSLGWAFYRFGMYNEAVTYLEKATEADPSNPVINDHLGDAYWQTGRKNEAGFQWNHALSLKDTTGEIDPQTIKNKIENGLQETKVLKSDKEKLTKIISEIKGDATVSE